MAAKRRTLAEWLGALPEDAAELRLRGGPSSREWDQVATILIGKRTPADLEDAVDQALADAGGWPVSTRLDAYTDKGKFLVQWQTSDPRQVGGGGGQAPALDATELEPMALAWRVADRSMTMSERLVDAFNQPLAAMADLFKAERERADDMTGAAMEATLDRADLRSLLERAMEADDDDPLATAAADLVNKVGGNLDQVLDLFMALKGAPPASAPGPGGGGAPGGS